MQWVLGFLGFWEPIKSHFELSARHYRHMMMAEHQDVSSSLIAVKDGGKNESGTGKQIFTKVNGSNRCNENYAVASALQNDMLERREAEMKLVNKFDTETIDAGKECWFLIDKLWIDAWSKFVTRLGPPPGPVSNHNLLGDQIARTPKSDLKPISDYRGVNPRVWALYVELYGSSPAQPLCRWVVDIDKEPVDTESVNAILELARSTVRTAVSEMRFHLEGAGQGKMGGSRQDGVHDISGSHLWGQLKLTVLRMWCCSRVSPEKTVYRKLFLGQEDMESDDDYYV